MLKTYKNSFVTGSWLGWQVESNWTDPLVFFGLSILKPIASVLILVFMYQAVSRAGTGAPIYAYIFLGNAFYIYVGAVMAGASYSILDDRERYRALKYLYIAPISIPAYLLGRAVARFVIGSMAVVITLGAGVLFFSLPINLAQADWLTFGAAMLLGLTCLVCMGITLGMWTLTVRTEPWFIAEGFAAAMYLFSGAIFPITILPAFLQPIGFALPLTYWLELIRRALLGAGADAFPTLAGFSNLQLFAILGAITLAFAVAARFGYGLFDRQARDEGMIDEQHNF